MMMTMMRTRTCGQTQQPTRRYDDDDDDNDNCNDYKDDDGNGNDNDEEEGRLFTRQ